MRAGSLFSGGGGLDLAVEALFDVTWAWHAEADKAARKVLDVRWPDTPNLGDLREVDWTSVEPVDLLVGGYPCQPWSNAGKRKGADDDRDGWPWFRDAVRHLGPGLVLLENVRGHAVPAGAGRTVGDLSDLGYDAVWTTVRASDVGAPHRRERWFCVAYPDVQGLEGWDPGSVRERGGQRPAGQGDPPALMSTPTAALAGGVQSLERQTIPERDAASMLPTPRATRGGSHTETQRMLPTPMAGDAKSARNSTATRHTTPPTGVHAGDTLSDVAYADRWGDYAPAIARWEQILGRTAPDPTDVKARLNPAFVEWMMGWPEGWTDVGLSRANRLKILGNGVVPLQATAAYSGLLERQGVAA